MAANKKEPSAEDRTIGMFSGMTSVREIEEEREAIVARATKEEKPASAQHLIPADWFGSDQMRQCAFAILRAKGGYVMRATYKSPRDGSVVSQHDWLLAPHEYAALIEAIRAERTDAKKEKEKE